MLAPIILFVYKRSDHLRITLDCLLNNTLSNESELIIFSDAPKSESDVMDVHKVRELIKNIHGFKTISIHEREINFGLSKSIISGVSEVLAAYDKAIIIEDDMETSPYFLEYMNAALDKYSNEPRVASIHGYVYPTNTELPETFFLKGADCWGWGVWRRSWNLLNTNAVQLLKLIDQHNLRNQFDFEGTYPFYEMLKRRSYGKVDSWAILWHASIYLENMLTLYPGVSFVNNIGFDGSGKHCKKSDIFDVAVSTKKIITFSAEIKESLVAYAAFVEYFKTKYSFVARLRNFIKSSINF